MLRIDASIQRALLAFAAGVALAVAITVPDGGPLDATLPILAAAGAAVAWHATESGSESYGCCGGRCRGGAPRD